MVQIISIQFVCKFVRKRGRQRAQRCICVYVCERVIRVYILSSSYKIVNESGIFCLFVQILVVVCCVDAVEFVLLFSFFAWMFYCVCVFCCCWDLMCSSLFYYLFYLMFCCQLRHLKSYCWVKGRVRCFAAATAVFVNARHFPFDKCNWSDAVAVYCWSKPYNYVNELVVVFIVPNV